MKRITKVALGGIASCALVLGGTGMASGELLERSRFRDPLRDLLTDSGGPFDNAKARITIAERTNRTTFKIRVTGIDVTADPSIVGTTLGSHLHTGPCVIGTPSSAGPHYNHQVATEDKVLPVAGQEPTANTAEVSPDTEVWFDLVPDAEGVAYDETTVKFVPDDSNPTWVPGVMSVVIHDGPTNRDTGAAGKFRQACFPLSVPQWASAPSTE